MMIASIGLASCEKKDTPQLEMKHIDVTSKQTEVINSWNKLGFDLFKEVYSLSNRESNLMISPLSVSMALGMTRNGADGTTLNSMTDMLGFSQLENEEINESYKYLVETFLTLDPSVKLAIANSIWYKNTFSVDQSFINTNQSFFKAQVSSLDFNNPTSVNVINNWVSDNTNKLIPSIIDEIPSNTVMYLINAVYFKGQWRNQFKKENTRNQPFKLADGKTVQVPMMSQQVKVPMFVSEDFSAVELAYNRGNFNMTVLLPNEGITLEQVIGQLSSEYWETKKDLFHEVQVTLQLPKFKYSYDEEKMKEVLTTLGMGEAFNPTQANFSRINSSSRLYISDIRHKTFIETNEEGTEAAAVTSVEVGVTSAPMDNFFIVNKPFVFMITEKSTGTILFIGSVSNPLKE
jgi:serpin B